MIRFLLAIALSCAVSATSSQAVQRLPRVGVLYLASPSAGEGPTSGFDKGMRELGYVPGRNVVIEWRYAEGRPDRLPVLAAELVADKVDVIVTGGPGPLAAVRFATTTVPIVTVSGSDPVAEGWATTLARPGGNITGLTVTYPELEQKRLEILKEVLPAIARVAVIVAPRERDTESGLSEQTTAAAKRLGLQLQVIPVRNAADLEDIGRVVRQGRPQAVVTVETTFVLGNRPRIAEQAELQGIPVTGEFTIFGADEILLAYGADLNDLLRRAATHVDRILKGARAGDVPIERPSKLELTVNRKVARRLGITFPQSILLRADRVIE